MPFFGVDVSRERKHRNCDDFPDRLKSMHVAIYSTYEAPFYASAHFFFLRSVRHTNTPPVSLFCPTLTEPGSTLFFSPFFFLRCVLLQTIASQRKENCLRSTETRANVRNEFLISSRFRLRFGVRIEYLLLRKREYFLNNLRQF